MSISTLKINTRQIGKGRPAYIIAEMSANHNQNFDKAVSIIKAAAEAGADAVKLQTYTAESLTIDSPKKYFRLQDTIWKGKTLFELYSEASTPWEWTGKLQQVAQEYGLDLFSTPFDNNAVDFLEKLAVPAYKVASFEIVDIPLLTKIAKTGKPVILSTGMASFDEISEAVLTLTNNGCPQLALLKCTSAYPAPPEEANLRTIPHLKAQFNCPVGISDHTLGDTVTLGAIALGASIIEKHFTLSRNEPGPDNAFSIEPGEFREMVDRIRIMEKAMGEISYEITENQKKSRIFRRSLFAVKDIGKGEAFTPENVRSIRPGFGMHPRYFFKIMEKTAAKEIKRGTPLSKDMIA